MKKRLEILLTSEDEENLSVRIRQEFPDVTFIDNMYWPTAEPPRCASIATCESKFVYIWNTQLFPEIFGKPRESSGFYGPQSGIVIHLIRSQIIGNELLSGTLGVGFDPADIAMKSFVENVWKILRGLTPCKIVQVNPLTREILSRRTDIRLGIGASKWCKADDGRFLRFSNSPFIYMKPVD